MSRVRSAASALKEWASTVDDLHPEVLRVVEADDQMEQVQASVDLYVWWQTLKQPVQLPVAVLALLAAVEADLSEHR